MKFIIVNKEDLKIMGSYEADAKDDSSANRSWLLAEPVCKHLELPVGLEEELAEAVLVEGEIQLQLSQAKETAQIARAWDALRAKRDQLLVESDRYMLSDYPINAENKTAMQNYRNALRDLPSTVVDPRNAVSWPEKPSV